MPNRILHYLLVYHLYRSKKIFNKIVLLIPVVDTTFGTKSKIYEQIASMFHLYVCYVETIYSYSLYVCYVETIYSY